MGSGVYHSFTYHNKTDGLDKYLMAYRSVEQFWHPHKDEHRFSVSDLWLYMLMSPYEVDEDLETRGFSAVQYMDERSLNRYWRYRSSQRRLSQYEVGYIRYADTIAIVYLLSDFSHFKEVVKELASESDTSYVVVDSLPNVKIYRNDGYDLAVLVRDYASSKDDRHQIMITEWQHREYLHGKVLRSSKVFLDGY